MKCCLGEHISSVPARVSARTGAQDACVDFHAGGHDLPARRSGPRDVYHRRRCPGSNQVRLAVTGVNVDANCLINQLIDSGDSETGQVLTTMKSGDFFGEIGILNLDGLNK